MFADFLHHRRFRLALARHTKPCLPDQTDDTLTAQVLSVAGDKDRWNKVIKPAMGYFGIPVLDLPDGTFISDTTAIIRYLEEKHPEPAMQPADPVMRALAAICCRVRITDLGSPVEPEV